MKNNEIKYFELNELEDIHNKLIETSLEWEETWSFWYIWWRDSSDLYSIVEFMKNDLYYETFEEKLTYLFYSINKNHIFKDWNKRSSLYFSAYFLHKNWFNEWEVIDFIREFEDVTVELAANTINRDELYEKVMYFLRKTNIIN